MSDQDILGQDEIDALINGAQQDAAAEVPAGAGEAQAFDFGTSARESLESADEPQPVSIRAVARYRAAIVDTFFGGTS